MRNGTLWVGRMLKYAHFRGAENTESVGCGHRFLPNGVFQRPVSCLVSCESVYREEGEISVAKCLRFTFRGEGVAAVGSALVIWSLGDTLQENAETHLLE